MGKIFVVGFGAGDKQNMTFEAYKALETSEVVVGYTKYVELMRKIFPEKRYVATGMKKEVDRCRIALDYAMMGKRVAFISSGDSGIYGMAGIMLEVAKNTSIEVEIVSGVTALSSCASILGAPVMHDFAVISLSDLMTPTDLIYKRVECVAMGDFVICLYNPKSKKRVDYIAKTADIIMLYRNEETPVGIVRNAHREDQSHEIITLKELKNADVDMFSTVIIGNSQTYVSNGKMITPRGYKLGGGRF